MGVLLHHLTPSDLGMSKLFALPSARLNPVAVKGDLVINDANRDSG